MAGEDTSLAVQRRGGTTTEHATFIGKAREITIDTTKKTVVVHDGTTTGGIPLAKEPRPMTTAQNATYTGYAGEMIRDTDKKCLVLHDGIRAGGYPIAKEAMSGIVAAVALGG